MKIKTAVIFVTAILFSPMTPLQAAGGGSGGGSSGGSSGAGG